MRGANFAPYPNRESAWHDLAAWGRGLLDRAEGRKPEAPDWETLEGRARASAAAGVFLPFPYLQAALGLDRVQSQCLALALLPELEEGFADAYAALEPVGEGFLTAGLALCLLEGTGRGELRSALAPSGALMGCALEPAEGPTRLTTPLRPERRVVDFALWDAWEEPETPGLTLVPAGNGAPFPPELWDLAGRMAEYLRRAEGEHTTFLLTGLEGAGRRTLARALARRLEGPLLLADGAYLRGEGGEAFRRALLREERLQHCGACLTGLDGVVEEARTDPSAAAWLGELLDETARAGGVSLLVCGESWPVGASPAGWRPVTVPLPLPGLEESRRLWSRLLADQPLVEEADPARLAGAYRLTPGQMRRALDSARSLARWAGLDGVDRACLEEGCRSQLRRDLGEKARKVEAAFTWDDLILPPRSKRLLRSACDQMKHRPQVYGAWGFGEKLAYGAGLSMLFSGPPGTGKTMGAQIAAGELGLELYKVDLSAVVSKYVGETEKNLSAIFREASRSQAVLFFDEADVLFSKRTEVKDAHDKYNNMEAAYLLQKIEEYEGVSILATNFLQNFDEAFKRRLKFIIPFPFPDAHYRLLLWRSVFPKKTPVEADVDWEYLAGQFELTGSGIKNVAVNAAFLAAGEGRAVGMEHLLTAVRRELSKSGKVLTRADFGEYYMLAEEDDDGEF